MYKKLRAYLVQVAGLLKIYICFFNDFGWRPWMKTWHVPHDYTQLQPAFVRNNRI